MWTSIYVLYNLMRIKFLTNLGWLYWVSWDSLLMCCPCSPGWSLRSGVRLKVRLASPGYTSSQWTGLPHRNNQFASKTFLKKKNGQHKKWLFFFVIFEAFVSTTHQPKLNNLSWFLYKIITSQSTSEKN